MSLSDTILVVDDDEDTRLLVSEIVRLAGYEATCAGQFVEAREALTKHPAAVLLDLVMPDQLCIRVAAYMADEMPHTPVVLMSVTDEASMMQAKAKLTAIGLRVVATLRKPFWIDGLLSALAEALPHAAPSSGLSDEEQLSGGALG